MQDNISEREALFERSWGSLPFTGMGEELDPHAGCAA